MAKGGTCVPKPPAKRQRSRKSTVRVDQPKRSTNVFQKMPEEVFNKICNYLSKEPSTELCEPRRFDTPADPFTRLQCAERDSRDKFACWSCLKMKAPFEFEAEQPSRIRRMDLPGHPVQTMRRVCIECGIGLGLYRPGHIIARNHGLRARPECWVCHCYRPNDNDGGAAGDESFRCHECGMAQPFSMPPTTTTQNRYAEIVPIYPRRTESFTTTVDDLDAPTAQLQKTSIPYLLSSYPRHTNT